MTTILDFSEIKARDFLLREDSYSNIDLPEYITFQKILKQTENLKNTKDKTVKKMIKIILKEF